MVPYPDARLQKAFLKIKEDISFIYTQILRDRQLIIDISVNLSSINSKMSILGKKLDLLLKNGFSIRNEGVNDALTTRQRLVDGPLTDRKTLENAQSKPENVEKEPEVPEKDPLYKLGFYPKKTTYYQPVNDALTIHDPFLDLSKSQLQMYITIFRLEEELNRPVTLEDLSKKISRTDSAVRHYIRMLKIFKIPLNIYRNPDNILCITIPEKLRTPEFEKILLDLLDSIHHRKKRD